VDDAFRAEMAAGYTFNEPVIVLGSPIMGDEVLPEVRVALPLSRVNRHGLIAGATGTGKTSPASCRPRASRCSPWT
jgi:DNA helicase HerA-like ATPase